MSVEKARRTKHYYLTEETSKRSEGEATNAARNAESDDVGDASDASLVEKPDENDWAENRVATSLDDE